MGNAWLLPFPLFFSCVLPAGAHTLKLMHTLIERRDREIMKELDRDLHPCYVIFLSQASFSLVERLSLEMLATPTLRPVCFGSEDMPCSSSLNQIKRKSLMCS